MNENTEVKKTGPVGKIIAVVVLIGVAVSGFQSIFPGSNESSSSSISTETLKQQMLNSPAARVSSIPEGIALVQKLQATGAIKSSILTMTEALDAAGASKAAEYIKNAAYMIYGN